MNSTDEPQGTGDPNLALHLPRRFHPVTAVAIAKPRSGGGGRLRLRAAAPEVAPAMRKTACCACPSEHLQELRTRIIRALWA